jgi:hypothetical protein
LLTERKSKFWATATLSRKALPSIVTGTCFSPINRTTVSLNTTPLIGSLSDWLKPAGRSNGTYFDQAGNLLACADDKNELWSISPDKKVTVLLSDFGGKLLNGPNDLWIRPDGNLYFTDPLYARNYWKRDKVMQQPGQYVYFFDMKTKKATPVRGSEADPTASSARPTAKRSTSPTSARAKRTPTPSSPTAPSKTKRSFAKWVRTA